MFVLSWEQLTYSLQSYDIWEALASISWIDIFSTYEPQGSFSQ